MNPITNKDYYEKGFYSGLKYARSLYNQDKDNFSDNLAKEITDNREK